MTPFPNHEDKAIILYDGVCVLCNGFVQFLMKRDRKRVFRFAPIQSEEIEQWMEQSLDEGYRRDTVVLWYEDTFYTKSEVALKGAKLLPFPWNIFHVFRIIPRSIRDSIYDWIARNRYEWFGKKDQCPVPSPEQRRRFISWPYGRNSSS